MKKIWIGVLILGLGMCGFAGGFYYKDMKNSNTQQFTKSNIQLNTNTKSSSYNENSAINNNENKNNPITNNRDNSKNINLFNNQNNSNNSVRLDGNVKDNMSSNNTTVGNNTLNKDNKNNMVITSSNINNNKNSESNISSSIKWVLGQNHDPEDNTIVVRNNTGENISNEQLVAYIKNWMENEGCDATMWAPEFLNAVPDDVLIKAFINCNGEEALSKNITASELANTNIEVGNLVVNNKNQPLLSQSQIFEYIYENILPKDQISKIENHKYYYAIYAIVNGKQLLYNCIDKYTGMTAC